MYLPMELQMTLVLDSNYLTKIVPKELYIYLLYYLLKYLYYIRISIQKIYSMFQLVK